MRNCIIDLNYGGGGGCIQLYVSMHMMMMRYEMLYIVDMSTAKTPLDFARH